MRSKSVGSAGSSSAGSDEASAEASAKVLPAASVDDELAELLAELSADELSVADEELSETVISVLVSEPALFLPAQAVHISIVAIRIKLIIFFIPFLPYYTEVRRCLRGSIIFVLCYEANEKSVRNKDTVFNKFLQSFFLFRDVYWSVLDFKIHLGHVLADNA